MYQVTKRKLKCVISDEDEDDDTKGEGKKTKLNTFTVSPEGVMSRGFREEEFTLENISALIEDGKLKVDTYEGGADRTLLCLAAHASQLDILVYLIRNGAQVNQPNGNRYSLWTPLHYAASKGDIEAVRILLAGGANPCAQSFSGKTPLDYVMGKMQPNEELVTLLEKFELNIY